MNYVVGPFELNLNEYDEVGIWCSLPAALSSLPIASRPPKIHVHVRPASGGKKTIDRDFHAIAFDRIDPSLKTSITPSTIVTAPDTPWAP
jgi:hypothetical protein